MIHAQTKKTRVGAVNGRQIALIHVAKAKVGMEEDAYRDMLRDVSGAESSKDLTTEQFEECMKRFEALGFKSAGKSWPPSRASRVSEKPAFLQWERGLEPSPEKKPLMSKISALLAAQGKGWAYAHGMARRMFGVEKVVWCDFEQLHKIAAALSIHGKRLDRKGAGDAAAGVQSFPRAPGGNPGKGGKN